MAQHASPRTHAERFVALWSRCAPPADPGEARAIHARLCAAYREAGRHYHALSHIDHCLREFDEARHAMLDADAVELALWYHDAVYQPGDSDNEQRSAALFAADSAGRLPDARRECISALILATTHDCAPQDALAAWVVDIDLSSFGLPWPAFLDDSHAVRAEMTGLADDEYKKAHGGFLRRLAARERIFTSAHFHARYEHQARANITRLLDAYAAGTTL